MALKTEFDSKSFNVVLMRSLIGAVLGALPGALYVIATGNNLATDAFGVGLVQMGMVTGAIVLGLASLAATINATLKSRGSGPSGKAKRLNEYLNPDTLPAIPPASKPVKDTSKEDTTEVHLPAMAPKPLPVPPIPTPAIVQPEQPVFEDYDRSQH